MPHLQRFRARQENQSDGKTCRRHSEIHVAVTDVAMVQVLPDNLTVLLIVYMRKLDNASRQRNVKDCERPVFE